MNKILFTFIILLSNPFISFAQDEWFINLQDQWKSATHDTTRVLILAEFSNFYKYRKLDSALAYGYKSWSLAREIDFPKGEIRAIQYIALAYHLLGNDSKGLQICLQGIEIADENGLIHEKAVTRIVVGRIYLGMKNHIKALHSFRQAKQYIMTIHAQLNLNKQLLSDYCLVFMANAYLDMNKLDSATYYCHLAYDETISKLESRSNWVIHPLLLTMARIEERSDKPSQAINYLRQSLLYANAAKNLFDSNIGMAQNFKSISMLDSAFFYTNKSQDLALQSGFHQDIIEAKTLMSALYEKRDLRQALRFSNQVSNYKDSLLNMIKSTSQQNITDFAEQQRKSEIESAKKDVQYRIRMNAFLGSSFTLIVIAIFLYRNNRMKQKAKTKIEKAYDELKLTQSQLIQSEKMASLGELTAGIAHEIQNPLNFVNNFSEVSEELVTELKEELEKGEVEEAKEISSDVIENLKKINHHGKRASSIVKGMLQHSRTSQGEKEPTDINALADEYLRLAYHGLRAKDKSFNADFKTEFDESLAKIDVIPQDIGRVMLNLINNAFYAVDKKAKEGIENYKPEVVVSTKMLDNSIEISVKDNGSGIPDDIKDKIFQPFFTTKPTGSGTGLGLSLSYDIMRAHGGEIRVESKKDKGTEIILILHK